MDGLYEVVSVDEAVVYRDGSITKRILFKEPQATAFVLNFQPGQALPPHTHDRSLLILQPLRGSGVLTVGDKAETIGPGQIARVDGDAVMSLACRGDEPLSVLVILAPTPADPRYTQPV